MTSTSIQQSTGLNALPAKSQPSVNPTVVPPPAGHLVLYIASRSAGAYPLPPQTILTDQAVADSLRVSAPIANTGALGLLTGTLVDFQLYAQQEHSDWLLDMAHCICDPREQRGALWVEDPASNIWRPVQAGEPLVASNYEYHLPQGVLAALTKISTRHPKSATTETGTAGTMFIRVIQRDTICWVSHTSGLLINSHICPKRMGDALARRVLEDFSGGTLVVPNATIYDQMFGCALSRTLDGYFDLYRFGLRVVNATQVSCSVRKFVGNSQTYICQNQYVCHSFVPSGPGSILTLYGELPPGIAPEIHGQLISPPDPHAANLPPPAVFRWHYTQCVIEKFKHSDYGNTPHIEASTVDIRYENDESDESDGEPNWPSAPFDLARLAAAEEEEEAERMCRVADWAAGSTVFPAAAAVRPEDSSSPIPSSRLS